MTERDWTDRIVGDRMTVDRQFADRVEQSQFSRQQWGLIMTAVEFDIEHPGDEERARIVPDTTHLSDIMPELDNVDQAMGAMGGGGRGGGGGNSGGGVFASIKRSLGLSGSGGGGDERLDAAERLVEQYATDLQSHLEEKGKWAEVRSAAGDQ
ncbi:hypothetical protein BRC83_08530 [Halobacteriales archaeon QS_1_68_17]|nr:MAG: hypothetical protein BRC83_08530 [Halobacteriales archaeon QS_1_68_17]